MFRGIYLKRQKTWRRFCIAGIACMLLAGCSNKDYLKNTIGTTQAENATGEVYREDRFSNVSGLCASSESGVYVQVINMKKKCRNIYYYDFAAGTASVWCNKLQCTHDGRDCVSYIEGSSTYKDLYYSGGHLYKIVEEDAGLFLEGYQKDASAMDIRLSLLPKGETAVALKYPRFYKSCLYYWILNQSNQYACYRLDVSKTAEPELLFEAQEDMSVRISPDLIHVNDSVLRTGFTVWNNEGEGYKKNRYCLDINSKKLEIERNVQPARRYANDKLYVQSANGLTVIDSQGHSQELTIDGISGELDSYAMLCNERYLTFDNYSEAAKGKAERKIYVYEIATGQLRQYALDVLAAKVDLKWAMPVGMDANAYYVMHPKGSDSNLIRFRLDSMQWEEFGEYSEILVDEKKS